MSYRHAYPSWAWRRARPEAEAKAAWRRLVSTWHPDRQSQRCGGGSDAAHQPSRSRPCGAPGFRAMSVVRVVSAGGVRAAGNRQRREQARPAPAP